MAELQNSNDNGRFITTARPLTLALVLVAGPVCAFGQTASAPGDETPPAARQADNRPTAISEIVVTAQKRSARLQDVPLSITALDEQLLENMGADSFVDYARTVPGLSFANRGPNRAQIIVRGMSPLTGAAPVGLYLDGIGVNNSFNNPDFQLFDVERVEVLRGPQGTLYGEGSLGGTIKIETNKPDPQAFAFRMDVGVGDTEDGGESYNVNAVVNMPLVEDRLAVRVAGFYRDDAGWIDNVFLDEKDVNHNRIQGGRAAIRFDATDRLFVEGIVNVQETEIGQLNVRSTGNPADFGLSLESFDRFDLVRTVPETEDETNTQYTLLAEYQTEWGVLESVTGLNEVDDLRDQDSAFLIGVPGFLTTYASDSSTFNQEVRFVSDLRGAFDFAVGGFYRDRERDVALTVVNGGALFGLPGNFENTLSQSNRTTALFGEMYYRPVERLQATLGLRWSQEELHDMAIQQIGDLVASDTDGNATFDAVTPKFGLSYDVSDDVMLFAVVAEGFRSGGTNPLLVNDPAYVPAFEEDTAWSYELGVKSQYFERRLTVNATAYYTEWDNMQILGVPDNPALGFTTNAGAAHTEGVELETQLQPTENLSLTFAASYTEAELDEAAQGAPAGAPLPNVPEWALAGAIQYSRPLTSDMDGFLRFDWQYKSSTNGDVLGNPANDVPSYNIINARAGIERERWAAYLFAENLTNDLAITWAAASGQYIGRPRTIGLNLKLNF